MTLAAFPPLILALIGLLVIEFGIVKYQAGICDRRVPDGRWGIAITMFGGVILAVAL